MLKWNLPWIIKPSTARSANRTESRATSNPNLLSFKSRWTWLNPRHVLSPKTLMYNFSDQLEKLKKMRTIQVILGKLDAQPVQDSMQGLNKKRWEVVFSYQNLKRRSNQTIVERLQIDGPAVGTSQKLNQINSKQNRKDISHSWLL